MLSTAPISARSTMPELPRATAKIRGYDSFIDWDLCVVGFGIIASIISMIILFLGCLGIFDN